MIKVCVCVWLILVNQTSPQAQSLTENRLPFTHTQKKKYTGGQILPKARGIHTLLAKKWGFPYLQPFFKGFHTLSCSDQYLKSNLKGYYTPKWG